MAKEELNPLTDDIEVIGPGQMLSDARKKIGLSVEDVAKRLNFTLTLVRQLEAENFDEKLPVTFTRGYLKNYAKLVNISEKDIIASYEMLGVAKRQGAEMQSFSRITQKKAQNNRLMWISYFILAVLIALTVLWWLQDVNSSAEEKISTAGIEKNTVKTVSNQSLVKPTEVSNNTSSEQETLNTSVLVDKTVNDAKSKSDLSENTEKPVNISVDTAEQNHRNVQQSSSNSLQKTLVKSTAVFTFAGDCWVNIYDSTGERIAWGIKKSGYVMTIQGVAPLSITLGKPELVSIQYNNQSVDISGFKAGNIAKFTLPMSE